MSIKQRKVKIVICLVAMIIWFSFFFSNICLADDIEEEEGITAEEIQKEVLETAVKPVTEPSLNARSAIVYDRTTQTILYEKNSNTKRPMASTTKIATAIVTIEQADLNKVVTVSKKAAGTGGSRLGLKANDKLTLGDLLYGLMLCSGNDAAVAIAETVGGSIEGFAKLMNEKAQELGLVSTHFVTPHGLDNSEHYTTAYELVKLTDYALQNRTFASIVNTKNRTITINGYPKTISNTNELLGNLQGVNGVKTGFTNGAGRCLVTSCSREGKQIITVVLGDDTKKLRTSDSIKLIEYAFQNFEDTNIQEIARKEFEEWKQINENRITVQKGTKNAKIEVYLEPIKNSIIPIRKDKENVVEVTIEGNLVLQAPVPQDTVVGYLTIKIEGKELERVAIKLKETIKKKNIWEYFAECIIQYSKVKLF